MEPDCMIPDGADTCRGYKEIQSDTARLQESNYALEARVTQLVAALKRAEGYMFHACQPNKGDLFSEFDDKNRAAINLDANYNLSVIRHALMHMDAHASITGIASVKEAADALRTVFGEGK